MIQKWTNEHIPSCQGLIAVVTGANSGLGYHIALNMAQKGAHVIMACRNPDKAEQAAQSIKAQLPSANLEIQPLDLANLRSVHACAKAIQAKHSHIDRLINNAGVMFLPPALSPDGIEIQMASNHMGHFLLTGLLMPQLDAAPAARVVTMSSGFGQFGRLPLRSFDEQRVRSRHMAYCDAKLANLVFALELARRLAQRQSRTISLAAHPGYAATNLQFGASQKMESSVMAYIDRCLMKISNTLLAQSAHMGALPALYASTYQNAKNGDYIGPNGLLESRGYPCVVKPPRSALRAEKSAQFWKLSQAFCKIEY